MRVCFITNLYPPHARGGAERVVHEEVKALKKMGHEVSVITAEPVRDDGSIDPRMTVENGVRVHRFYPFNLFFYREIDRHGMFARLIWHFWDLLNFNSARTIRKILEDECPDIVHTHNLKGVGFLVPRMIRKLGIRHVHTVHDVQLAVPSGLIIKGLEAEAETPGNHLFAAVIRKLVGSPDIVVSPSHFLLKWYAERGFFPQSELILLPNPVPEVKSPRHHSSKEARFLFLGQIETHKGILWLLGAIKEFFKRRSGARLDIVGEGSIMKEAVALAGKEMRIAFYGKRHLSQFEEMFSQVDYTVLPSLCYENAPTVIGESFAHGVPVIVARIGGAAELVQDGVNGFVFEAGNVDSLSEALARACQEKDEWERLSHAAVRSADLLGSTHHVSRLLDVYEGRDSGFEESGPVIPLRYKKSSVSPETEALVRKAARKRRAEMRKKVKSKPARVQASKKKAKAKA